MKKFLLRLKVFGCLTTILTLTLLYFVPALRVWIFERAVAQKSVKTQETTRNFLTLLHVLPATPTAAPTPAPTPLASPTPQALPSPEPSPLALATPEPAATPEPTLVAERTAEEVIIRKGSEEVCRFSTHYKTDMPGGNGPAVVTGPHAWWGTKELLFHGDLVTKKVEVFLPYAGVQGEVTQLEAKDEGVIVTTSAGKTTRLQPDRHLWPGYLRAAFGPDAEIPPAKYAALKKQIDSWIGVPYKWGGDTKQGIDCSGFVCQVFKNVKQSLPRTSKEQAQVGKPVTDELHWGDLLCYDGHVSIYMGNGLAAEALGTKDAGGKVMYATIWHRPCLGARRVLPQ